MDTHIVESLADLVADGRLDAEYLNVESEHSAMAACIGAQATGVRTFTATSSQGLAYMWELLYVASGMLLPIVMAVATRALSAPLNIWGDWSDAIGARDSGWIQLYCETAQEAFDTIIQAYKIAEDSKVLLPVMICVDGFTLSHVYEPVQLEESTKGFLGDYKPSVELNPKKPISQGEYAGPEYYQEFKEEQAKAIEKSTDVIKKVNDDFAKKFGRSYGNGLYEKYNTKGAKHLVITMGSVAGTIKHIIEKEKIKDIGLLRIKCFRPFPKEIEKIINNFQSLTVIEKDISLGSAGALYTETKAISKKPISNFIGGLGGRDINIDNIKNIFASLRKKEEEVKWIK
ncbi:MAG TPA: pyruvate ferredoxin oxidoreductase [archaeon]|nr:pyruvate ferredoxin oxidoreductase [archaeon]